MHKETEIFIKRLKRHKGILSRQNIKTLRGQALSGDIEGARKGLNKILTRRSDSCDSAW
jgi:hypothetical protein